MQVRGAAASSLVTPCTDVHAVVLYIARLLQASHGASSGALAAAC
jgi:hypothetical protein